MHILYITGKVVQAMTFFINLTTLLTKKQVFIYKVVSRHEVVLDSNPYTSMNQLLLFKSEKYCYFYYKQHIE